MADLERGAAVRLRLTVVPRHRYFICTERDGAPVAWDPSDEAGAVRLDCIYFGRVFRAMEQHLPLDALTFYLTWDLERLPSYGDEVVAVVLGDEDSRIPRYVDDVRAVFKTYGLRPYVGARPWRERSQVSLLVLLQGVRRWLRHLPDDVGALGRRIRGRPRGNADPIPLGYYNVLELPLRDFDARSTSVFFAGSLERRHRHRLSPRRWLRMPKSVARDEMLKAVEKYQARRPGDRVVVRLTSTFASSSRTDPGGYSEALMDAKICLAPRGASVETYRLFEGLRYGCVVIAERLPATWFYEGSPVITVDRWKSVADVLERLLDDPAELRRRHEASLAWWNERCSEAAVGRFMAARIERAGPGDE